MQGFVVVVCLSWIIWSWSDKQLEALKLHLLNNILRNNQPQNVNVLFDSQMMGQHKNTKDSLFCFPMQM